MRAKEEDSEAKAQDIRAVISIRTDETRAFVPPLSDYRDVSSGWTETEYRALDVGADRVVVGFWEGEPGSVSFDAWPYTELCSIVSGRVAVHDTLGARREFGTGDAFIIPEGWPGTWETLEPCMKVFVAIYNPDFPDGTAPCLHGVPIPAAKPAT